MARANAIRIHTQNPHENGGEQQSAEQQEFLESIERFWFAVSELIKPRATQISQTARRQRHAG
jgi:hypothetical protein